jgi:putative transposase
MKKEEIITLFTKKVFTQHKRKNAVILSNINSTLIEAAANSAFVNESCKATEDISQSQIIYRKLEENDIDKIQERFKENTVQFLKRLKIFSRNRKLILSFDETEEAFYGELNKFEENLYLHDLVYKTKGAKYGYKYLTVAITCNSGIRYILDGIILKRGDFIEDYVYEMTKFFKEQISIDVVLFDRGFDNWGIIKKMQELKVHYMIFWKKQGRWYKEPLKKLKKGEFCEVTKKYRYCRDKSGYWVYSKFVIVKQLEYEDIINDWIFATDLNKNSSEKYVKRYKKRWGIETIFRVTDDIRIYTTSTNPLVRYFLFMFTCFIYNVWKFFQSFLGENFTLANFCVNLNKFMVEKELIHPRGYKDFLLVFTKYNSLAKLIR